MLVELRNFLAARGRVSISDLSLHFDTDPDALRGMLQHWMRKGKLVREDTNRACGGGCCKCAPEQTEIYRWVESQTRAGGPCR